MSRTLLAQHGTEFCLAAAGIAAAGVGAATVPAAVLLTMGAEKWSLSDRRTLHKARDRTTAALFAEGAITDADAEVVSEYLRGGRGAVALDAHTMVTAFATDDPGAVLAQAAFGSALAAETDGVRLALRLTLVSAARVLRDGNSAQAFTAEGVSALLRSQGVLLAQGAAIKSDTAALREETAGMKAMIAQLTAEVRGDAGLSYDIKRMAQNEKLLIAMAKRYAEGSPQDFDGALRGLERALEVAANSPAPSNLPSEVDAIVAEADRLSDAGELDAALAHMQNALADSADRILREEQARAQLVNNAIAKATLARNAGVLADLLVARITAEGGAQVEQFNAMWTEWIVWYERGRDRGLSFDLEVGIALAQRRLTLAQNADQRGAAGNELGIALAILGERASDNDLLEQAVTAFRAALTEYTQDRVPLDWAMTQNNLGNALRNLGTRAMDTDLLERAVTAYRAALTEQTQDRVPLDWAGTQNNLGNALLILGSRASDTDLPEQAVTAYRAALTEYTQDRVPLDWAMTQNNFGNALATLGSRASDADLLKQAVTAYRAALTERTQNRMPLDWAITQQNLANALKAWAGLTDGSAAIDHLKTALSHVDEALTVFSAEHTPYNHNKATRLRDHILAKLHP
ncbi:Tetratricopeptide repeat-containing protein [Loktanella sp. DSM 29012]|uniref:tetratricopeptide repeat protein n=1 Tax=Loktanella sp. DSM 29012 TaxID=1881056 RepID=UPI0008C2C975|nr:tetratricopeptide repeat protein [Loktanella sp. DSM 29012]SEQ42963.1 Tetratricopeptide repeat-containing protein [Loktanella sp. DSM 29012]